DRDGTLVLGTSHGLYRFKTSSSSFESLPLPFPSDIPEAATVTALHLDRNGVLWVAAVSGFYRLNKDGKWDRFIAAESPHVFVNAIAEDPQGNIWICTRQHGFGRFAGANGERAILEPWIGLKQGLPDLDIRTLWFVSDGRRWAATASGLVDWSN